MQAIPVYIPAAFIATALLTVLFFFVAAHRSKTMLLFLLGWLSLQTIVAYFGFYKITSGVPPHFILLILPPLLFIAALFALPAGRKFLDALDLKTLSLLHIVRIPVEVVLLGLFLHNAIPKIMTFEGRNFDVLSGLTAPLIFYFGFVKKRIGRSGLVLWNILCLLLLINIVVIAILSAPFVFQKFGFEQPDIALLYFPYVWLPCCVVPLVLLAHVASLRQLLLKKDMMHKSAFTKTEVTSLSTTSLK